MASPFGPSNARIIEFDAINETVIVPPGAITIGLDNIGAGAASLIYTQSDGIAANPPITLPPGKSKTYVPGPFSYGNLSIDAGGTEVLVTAIYNY